MFTPKKTRWSCTTCAFANLLGVTQEEFEENIKHDGSEVVYPQLQEPRNRRGFNDQELVDSCLNFGIPVTMILYNFQVTDGTSEPKWAMTDVEAKSRMDYYTKNYNGVLFGLLSSGSRHCLINYNGERHDPDTGQIFKGNIRVDSFYIVHGVVNETKSNNSGTS